MIPGIYVAVAVLAEGIGLTAALGALVLAGGTR